MLKSKITYIGNTILEPGQHVVMCCGDNIVSPALDFQSQIFVPDGYRFISYNSAYLRVDSYLFENIVPVKVKVYEKKGEKFCPEFGKPIK